MCGHSHHSSDDYCADDFGADGITKVPDWRGGGYTHYTAWSKEGGQVSWNEIELAGDIREVVDVHVSSRNAPKRGEGCGRY
jgi:hypothetical protein